MTDSSATRLTHALTDIVPVTDRTLLAEFIRLPWRIYKGDPAWTPPLVSEVEKQLRDDKNPYFQHAKARYWVARRNGQPVGRISAQIDDLAQSRHGEGTGHFGFLDAIDDRGVFEALFAAAEGWLTGQGMTRALGPFSLSINEESGLLIDGFDEPPRILMGHARPYYAQHVEALGYRKEMDILAYDLDIRSAFPAPIQRLIQKTVGQDKFTLRPIDMRRYEEDLNAILDIFNEAWSENWGYIPLTEAEVNHTVKSMKPIIREKLAYIAEMDGEAIGFMVTLPNLNEAAADLDGKLFPFGFLKLIWRLKVKLPKTLRVPLMGVRKRFQGRAMGALIAFSLIETIRRNAVAMGGERAELSWILENNIGMRQMLEAINCRIYKTYRIYSKELRGAGAR